MTEVFNVTEARKRWSELLNTVFRGRTRVIVEKIGVPIPTPSSPPRTWSALCSTRPKRRGRGP